MTQTAVAATPAQQRGAAAGVTPPRGRRSNPLLIALSVLLIIGSALLGGVVYLVATASSPVLVANRDLSPGEVVTRSDFREVNIGNTENLDVVSAEAISQLEGKSVSQRVREGQPVAGAMFSVNERPRVGYEGIGVTLAPDTLPPGAAKLDYYRVVEVTKLEEGGRQVLERELSEVAPAAQIVEIDEETVTLEVTPREADQIATAVGDIRLIAIPAQDGQAVEDRRQAAAEGGGD